LLYRRDGYKMQLVFPIRKSLGRCMQFWDSASPKETAVKNLK
jgi:hypothetical protein